jgi:hypothetical protein
MCAMLDANMAPAIRESRHADFPHGLLDLFATRYAAPGLMLAEGPTLA